MHYYVAKLYLKASFHYLLSSLEYRSVIAHENSYPYVKMMHAANKDKWDLQRFLGRKYSVKWQFLAVASIFTLVKMHWCQNRVPC